MHTTAAGGGDSGTFARGQVAGGPGDGVRLPSHAVGGSGLFLVGGVAAWVTVGVIGVAVVSHALRPPPAWAPGAAGDWFAYLWDHPVLGLLNLDLAMGIGLVFAVPLYLALYVALRRSRPSLMVVATAAALLATVLHLFSITALEMQALAAAHAAASDEAQRLVYLAAGEAALSAYYGTTFQMSYVVGYVAYVLIGAAILSSGVFGRPTAYLAIAIGVLGFGFYLPGIGLLLSVLVVLLIAVWNGMVGVRLLRVAQAQRQPARTSEP